MKKKVIIFDLDGTIADSMKSIILIMNRLSDEYHFKKIRIGEKDILRNKTTRKAFKDLGITIFKLPFIVRKIRSELIKEIENLKPIKNIGKVLVKLKRSGYILGILTSNSEENVRKFIEKNKLSIFDFIYSGSSIFGKSKILKSCIQTRKLSNKDVIYVGDETRDIEAAKKLKITSIAVSWGFNKREILASQNPDYLIDRPSELINIFVQFKAGP